MPELPEVETIVRALRDGGRGGAPILGCRFLGVELLWERTLAVPDVGEFQRRLPGQKIESIDRCGKFLLFNLSADTLLMHLRMSGDLRVDRVEQPAAPHDRALFYLDDGLRLAFNDPRKFGRIWLTADPREVLAGLGPEPFDPDLTPETLYLRLQSRRKQIKTLLLDQSFLAGIGNIYADEALHRAGLHPLRLSDSINPAESARLLEGIRAVLEQGILHNGASLDWAYRGGQFQNQFRVHQRAGELCYNCGTLILRQVVGQRSTYYCPVCQPADQR